MTNAKVAPAMLDMSFEPEIEQAFQVDYYNRIRTTLRATFIILSGLSVVLALLALIFQGSFAYCLPAVANLLLVSLAYRREFEEDWQPLVVGLSLVALLVPVFALARGDNENPIPIIYVTAFSIILGLRIWRLQLPWMVLLAGGILVLGSLAELRQSHGSWGGVFAFAFPYAVAMLLPLLLTFKQERFDRSQFLSKYLLTEERDEERRKREQTEKMLQVLSQAIGSIVHDLGNPLTTVQTGAETLLQFSNDGEVERELVHEFAAMITDGAQMLNYLRLSLMEETCVLEGKPSPVEPRPASLREIIATSAHYQKPRFASGRQVSLPEDDLEVCVDRMKLVTVFMNLIGNALKYSDGEVRIVWHTGETQLQDAHFLVAVLDEGKAGRGISLAQAEQLFVPFGRLDEHMQVEGTGLGLLSVKKIAEAHSGEVYIEGYQDGTPPSAPFTTAQRTYPGVLTDAKLKAAQQFRTAFVIACPLTPQPDEPCQISEPKATSPTTPAHHLEPELVLPAPLPPPVSQDRPLHPAQSSSLE